MRIVWITAIGVLTALLVGCKRETPAPAPAPPTTQASTRPVRRAPTTSYVQVIRANFPKLPATQPLDVPADLIDAGHYVLPEPIYLCPRGDLWITRSDAEPLDVALNKAGGEQVHIVPQRVYFAQWTNDENGKPFARIVIKNSGGDYEWIDGPEHRPLSAGRAYRWHDALYFGDDTVAVPTDRGVSVFSFTPQFAENYHDVVPAGSVANPPQMLLDATGLIAWSPWDGIRPGGHGAVHYADGKWTDLTSAGGAWPDKILHLVPLLDGSVLQLFRDDVAGPVKLALSSVTDANIDEKTI